MPTFVAQVSRLLAGAGDNPVPSSVAGTGGPPGHETESWTSPVLTHIITSPSVYGDQLPEADQRWVDPWPGKEEEAVFG